MAGGRPQVLLRIFNEKVVHLGHLVEDLERCANHSGPCPQVVSQQSTNPIKASHARDFRFVHRLSPSSESAFQIMTPSEGLRNVDSCIRRKLYRAAKGASVQSTHSFIHTSVPSFIRWLAHSFLNASTPCFLHSSIPSIHPSIHPSIRKGLGLARMGVCHSPCR